MKNPTSRGRLFRKYVVVLLVLVGGVLMASSLVELYFAYRETQGAIVRVERAKAVAAAARIEQFLKEIELQVRETTRTASDDPDASQVGPARLGFRQGLGAALAEQRELDFLRVLRNVPAIGQLSHLDLAGKEQLRVSRLEPDVVGSQEDFSRTPKFVEARAGKTYWSPVYLKNDSEPYVTLAVPGGKYAVEVTTAEVSLGAVMRIVSQIEGGPGGHAYVVDVRNNLVARPMPRSPWSPTASAAGGSSRRTRRSPASAGSCSSNGPPRTPTLPSGRRSSAAPSSSCWASGCQSWPAFSSPGEWSRRSERSRKARRESAPATSVIASKSGPATSSRRSATSSTGRRGSWRRRTPTSRRRWRSGPASSRKRTPTSRRR